MSAVLVPPADASGPDAQALLEPARAGALWMGIPILTRARRRCISRTARSLLTAVGLPDVITDSLAEYEKRAVALGRQPLRTASYKRCLAEEGRRSPQFDIPQRVRDDETEFARLALAHR